MDMNWKKIAMSFLLAAGLPLARNAQAQTTYEEMEQLTGRLGDGRLATFRW